MSPAQPSPTLIFSLTWENPQGARGEELRATWARLSIHVGATCVTEFYDASARTIRPDVYLPLYPLAEWIAINWWSITRENPRPGLSDMFWRHNLAAAREGFALPELSFYPQGDWVRVVWHLATPTAVAGRFIAQPGAAMLPLAEVQSALRALVSTVVARLDESKITETPLHKAWELVLASEQDKEEYEFCVVAGALGMDPYQLDQPDAIERVANLLPSAVHEEFFRAVRQQDLESEAKTVVKLIKKLPSVTANAHLATYRGAQRKAAPYRGQAWRSGYEIARAFRKDGGSWQRVGKKIPVETTKSIGSGLLFAGVVETGKHFALITDRVIGDQVEFLKAQAFCEQLVRSTDNEEGYALLSRAQTDRQARNRAFAAELLAPADDLRNALAAGYDPDDLESLSAHFKVSEMVIRHQLENHELVAV